MREITQKKLGGKLNLFFLVFLSVFAISCNLTFFFNGLYFNKAYLAEVVAE